MGHLFKKAPHSIVILRALQLGDLLCTVPAFRALREAFPKAHISLIGLPWAGAFVRRFPHYLDEFIEFPGWPGLPEREPQLANIPTFLEMMQSRRFDLALQMQGSGSITNSLVALFGARQTAGFYLPDQYRPNDRFFTPYPQGEHEIRIFLRLMEFLGILPDRMPGEMPGIPQQSEQLEFPVTNEEQQTFEIFRAANGLEPGRYICLHPGARAAARRLPPEKFAEVGDTLAREGFQVVVTGTEAERGLTAAITRHMHAPVLDAAGKTDLGTLALLLKNARLLVSNDTGVSHIAAAFETPSVILFTVSDPNRWRPLNHQLHRAIANAGDTSAEEILAVAEPLLKKGRACESEQRNYADQPA